MIVAETKCDGIERPMPSETVLHESRNGRSARGRNTIERMRPVASWIDTFDSLGHAVQYVGIAPPLPGAALCYP